MPYDALGNYVPGDEPDITQMQYELAKNGRPSPLDKVTGHFKNIVTQFNPIMMPKVMQDVGTMGTNIVSPIVSPYVDILHNVQAAGAAGLHRLVGDEKSAQEAEARQRPVTTTSLYREPSLPVVREAEQGLGQMFEASKLPPLGPGSGMPGSAPVSPRPLLTPNDLRVLGAEATRVGRQVAEIPTDYVNAQTGFQRIDPVTGQPVIGARLQSGVDRLGDIMEQRKMQGLTPIPGLPAALQPETSMFAVRPQGSRLTTPTIPETARGYNPPIDPINDMFKEVVGLDPDRSQPTPTVLHSLNRRVQIGNLPDERPAVNALRSFMEAKAKEMYPEAATPREALEIFNAMHYDQQSRHAVENKMFDEFLQTPEGQQFMPNAVSSEELAKRHEAATEGLKNMWGKYLIKNLGTEGNPLVKMAAEKGLTYLPAENVLQIAADEGYTTTQNRGKGGFPIQGTFAEPIANLKQEIEAINLPLQNAANAERTLGQAAHDAGRDPATVPEFLEARKTAAKLNKQKNELQKKLDNLTLASAYETIEDASVRPAPAETMLKEMHAAERGFYPSLKEAAKRGETGYKTSIGSLQYLGFVEAADKFYNDVLQGKIPADKAATYPVDKYIRENAEARVKTEQAEKAKLEQQKANVMKSLFDSANALPDNKKFGNVGVVELTKDTPLDVANKEVAASTEALDICIGEGGSGSGTKNLFTGKKDPRYTPIVDLLTGEPNPKASRSSSGYVDSLQRGEQLPMFRDLETGMPVAALQFHVASAIGANGQPKYNIGYASGAGNGRIESKYVNGIRDYLNSRANDISGIGNNLEDNTGIYDTTNRSSLSKARKSAQVSENEMKAVDWNSMPRFMTAEDVKQAIKGIVPATVTPQRSLSLQEDIAQLKATLIDNIGTVVDDAIQNSNLDVPEDLERRLGVVFSAMQSEYFPTFFDDPVSSMTRALEYLRYEIDRRGNNASELSQEMAEALDNYAAELESARDDLVSQQQRAVQQAHQMQQPEPQVAPMQQAEQLLQRIERLLRSTNDGIVNDALQEYARSLQRFASNQLENGLSPIEVAGSVRDAINTLRNVVLAQPTDFTRNFTPDQLGDYVSALRQTIDGIGQWLESQQQRPQTPNLPAEVQQNIDNRNRQITSAYQRPLDPDSAFSNTNDALSEFIDLLDGMSTNLFGNGYNTSEIIDHLQARIRAEIIVLANPDNVTNRGLNNAEADVLRDRLNNAYGSLAIVHDQLNAQGLEQLRELPVDFFEPDETHPANQPAQDPQRTVFDASVGNFINRQIQELRDVGTPAATDAIDNVLSTIATVAAGANMFNDPQEAVRLFRQGATSWGNAAARQALSNIARAIELNHPTMQRQEPVNQQYTVGDAISMAQDLFEQERIDVNNFDINSIQDSINLLREGLFDDERIRRLSPRDQVSFAEDVAFRLQNMLDDLRGRRSNRDLVADPSDAREALDNALANIENDYGIEVANDASMMRQSISEHVNPGDELSEYVYQLRRGRPGMSEDLRQALDHMAEELESISREVPQNAPTPVPAQPATAPYMPITEYVRNENMQELTEDTPQRDLYRAYEVRNEITDVNSPEEIQNIIGLVRTHVMGPWENFSDVQREVLARSLEDYVRDNTPPNTPPEVDNVFGATGQALRITDRDRELYAMLSDVIDNAIEEGAPLPDPTDGEAYAQLILNDEIGGEFTELTDTERRRLASIVRRYGADATLPPEGHKDGGRIRKYQEGGLTSDYGEPNNAPVDAFDLMKLERWMSKHPEFHTSSKEFNDSTPELERDEDAQVPRESTFDAKLQTPWEDDQWVMRNYIRKHYMQTFAKGGTVHTIPSVDQMKLELMMRRA